MMLSRVGPGALVLVAVALVAACSSDDTASSDPFSSPKRDAGAGSSSGDGDGGGELDAGPPALPLTCEWMRDAGQNCWRTVFEKVKTCLPAGDEAGTLSGDRATCTYAESSVSIVPAAAKPWSLSKLQKFALTTSGGTCVTFETLNPSGSEYRISSAEGSVEVRFPKPRELTLVCPDGKRYGGNADTLFAECGSIPGISTLSDHDVGISMFPGDGTTFDPAASLTLFSCD